MATCSFPRLLSTNSRALALRRKYENGWLPSQSGYGSSRYRLSTSKRSPTRSIPGSGEAIALARMVDAHLLLIDDADGRLEARRLNLRVTGTLGVLRVAGERNLIDVGAVIANLKVTNFCVDDDLIRSIFGMWLV